VETLHELILWDLVTIPFRGVSLNSQLILKLIITIMKF
jgi:hypothetical protein